MIEETKKKLLKVAKIILILFLIYLSFKVGFAKGLFVGVGMTHEIYNKSICGLLGLEEEEGYCLFSEDSSLYDIKYDCVVGKFKTTGTKRLTKWESFWRDIGAVPFEFIMNCKREK